MTVTHLSHHRRRLAAGTVVLLGFVSCLHGGPPSVTPGHVLALGEEPPAATSTAPFGVVFSGPRGATSETAQVTLLFNRPMRALDLAGGEAPSPARLTTAAGAPVGGQWHWLGTSALVFAPKNALPRATEYLASVPAGTRALDGSTLAQAFELRFSTPALRVTSVDHDGDEALTPASTFEVRFNQPVDPDELARHAALQLGEGKAARSVPIAVGRGAGAAPDTTTRWTISPRSPLPLGTRVVLSLDKALRGIEGPLPLGTPHVSAGRTYGPLVVSHQPTCDTDTPHKLCDAQGTLNVEFSNAVPVKELVAHARLDGGPKLEPYSGTPSVSHGFALRLAAGRAYRLVVTAGLRDVYGQTLATDTVWSFRTDDAWPTLELGLDGEVFEPPSARHGTQAREVPVAQLNVPLYRVAVAPLDEAALARWWSTRASFASVGALPGGHVETVTPATARNVQSTRRFPIDSILAARGGRGPALVGVEWKSRWGERQDVRLVQVTDLGVSAKLSRFGSLVWVTRLSDGKPVANAQVSVRDRNGAERVGAKTDSNGVATIPADRYAPIPNAEEFQGDVLVARLGADWTAHRVSDVLYSWDVSTDYRGDLHTFGMVFTDRGMYRPGEIVHANVLLRTELPKGTATPASKQVHVTATDARGATVVDVVRTLGAFGEATLDVPIPKTAPLGGLSISVSEGDTLVAGTGVDVEEYRPAEFKVTVEPERSAYVRGDALKVATRGDFLFGAPMIGSKVRMVVTRGVAPFSVPNHEDFTTGDDAYGADLSDAAPRAGVVQSSRGELGAKGDFAQVVPLAMAGQRGPEIVEIESEVEDLSRQTVTSSASVLVHPGEFYLGLGPQDGGFVAVGSKVRPSIVAADAAGRRRAGVAVHVRLLARTWQSVLRAAGDSGATYDSRAVDTEVASCDVVTVAAPVSCDLVAMKGAYYILRATARDARGNPVAASQGLYAVADDASFGWPMGDGRRIELVADKASYAPGEVARVLVKNPWPQADALVTVERAGVYDRRRETLKGSMPTLLVPIAEDMRPNVFVGVHVVRGRVKNAAKPGEIDAGAPAYRTGHVELRVNPESRRLKVKVVPSKKDYRPGEQADVDVSVLDRAGKPVRAAVTFYAVDEGVLMLTAYRTPDPLPIFARARPLSVFTLETRANLARLLDSRLTGAGQDKGRDGGGGGDAARTDFRATAHFEPNLLTDAGGTTHVRFRLPDTLTTFRLMAVVAAADDRFGSGDSQVTTSRRLMARPALPRFLRAGDAISAGVVVSAKNFAAPSVDVSLDLKGATLLGDAKRTVSLPASGSAEVRFNVRADRAGTATFSFRASGGGESDAVRVQRAVQIPTVGEAVALYGDTTDSAGEKLGNTAEMRDDYGSLDVRLASSAMVGLEDGLDQLVDYPYGCTEQLTSRIVPLVLVRAFATQLGVVLPKDVDARLDDALAKLVKNQRPDGTFGYWPESTAGAPWLTAYALWGLSVAKGAGRAVPPDAIASATRALRTFLGRGALAQDAARAPARELGLAEAAFVVDVLAMVGAPDAGTMQQLWSRRDAMPIFARAQLAHAMTLGKMDHKQVGELLRDVGNHLRLTTAGAVVAENTGSAYAVLLDSEARTTAIVLRALVVHDRMNPLAPRLVHGLLGARRGGTWRSTQETAWALLALYDYAEAAEATVPAFDAKVFFGDELLGTRSFHGRSAGASSVKIDVAHAVRSAGAGLVFQVAGQGHLFYEARLRYARKTLPATALDRGFFVRKTMRALRPEELERALGTVPDTGVSKAHGGELVLVDLVIVNASPREQVVIEDPLPAGLEAIDAHLATTAHSLDVPDDEGDGRDDGNDDRDAADDARAMGRAFSSVWTRRELRDDRVLTFAEHMPAGVYHYRTLARATTVGTFVVPPTKVECMYEPETFGRTGATTFEVTP